MSNSLPYQPFLISRLKDPTYCEGYIETCLEETSPDPGLLKLVLSDVAEALTENKLTPEQLKQILEQLDNILSKTGQEVIFNLANWLKSLGLKLSVNAENPKIDRENCFSSIEFIHHLLSNQNIDYSIRLKAAESYQINLENDQEILRLISLLIDQNIDYPIRLLIAGKCSLRLKDQKAESTFINLLADPQIEYSIRIQLAKSLGNKYESDFSVFLPKNYQLT
jgi:DNA-binding phage protein